MISMSGAVATTFMGVLLTSSFWFILLNTGVREVVFKGETTTTNFTWHWKFRGHCIFLFVDNTLFCNGKFLEVEFHLNVIKRKIDK